MGKITNGTWKVVATLAAALITIGALCATIRSNEKRIEKVEIKAEENKNSVTELKTDIKYIRHAVDEIKSELRK